MTPRYLGVAIGTILSAWIFTSWQDSRDAERESADAEIEAIIAAARDAATPKCECVCDSNAFLRYDPRKKVSPPK